MNDAVSERIEAEGVIAVVSLPSADQAVPLTEALIAGGINAIELTLRTPAALAALEQVCANCHDMLVGAGTVLTPDQVRDVQNAGATFAVSPGCNRRVIEAAQAAGLPFAPGVCTPSDIEVALEYDCRLLKYFPAEPRGGLKFLRVMSAPYKHLGVRFVPLGGVSDRNAADYLAEPSIAAIGGSWIAPPQAIEEGAWDGVTERARGAREIVSRLRSERAAAR